MLAALLRNTKNLPIFLCLSCATYLLLCWQAHPNPSVNWSQQVLKALRLPNIMHEEVPNKPLDYYTCPFKKSKLDR
jgi:hypothetical protein